ncbi:unnamed protein product [Thlaspi arvense]|uniref:FHA domain-containing protein n=1 Tax=Thlaspi arvense TaxID=13288 RepID=A0AAU9RMT3_THLAR|nr:unnamed protein product [Thlaspi arvense]
MNLKLAFVEGPREGESVEYKPGSTIRIGRLVRGNEIAIKDVGISTKHIRIVSESEKWIIYDLGSRNGTILNSETLDRDTPVNLRHGDVIKLGGDTSIVVNFEADAQAQEHKLPPRPRRNNRRLPVADPDPDPVESVQEKPTRKRRSAKEDEHEPPKRSKKLEDIAKEVNSRVTRSRRKMDEEVPVEKKGNSRSRGGNKNTENLGLEENVEEKRPLRATRSKKRELGGDCFLELEMVLTKPVKAVQRRRRWSQIRMLKKKMRHLSRWRLRH